MPPWMILGGGRLIDSAVGLVVIALVSFRAERTQHDLPNARPTFGPLLCSTLSLLG
jgi:hypothetical protein